jgi:hypothetical protein
VRGVIVQVPPRRVARIGIDFFGLRHSIQCIIGWFAVLAGCIYIMLAFRLKKHQQPG